MRIRLKDLISSLYAIYTFFLYGISNFAFVHMRIPLISGPENSDAIFAVMA